MKAETLLRMIKESGEMKTPKYDNANTPDNHVGSKNMKKVPDPKKGLGKDPTMKPKAEVGTPKKKEKRATASGRIDPVGIKPKRTKGAKYGITEDSGKGGVLYVPQNRSAIGVPFVLGFVDNERGKRKRQYIVPNVEESRFRKVKERFGTSEEAYDFWSNRRDTQMALGKLETAPLVKRVNESSEVKKAKAERKMEPAKTASTRTTQDDSPVNKGDPGKPDKPEPKDKMVPNPVNAKKMKVRGQISEIEQLLGSKLKVDLSRLFEDEEFEDEEFEDEPLEDKYEIERLGVEDDDEEGDLDGSDLTDEEITGQFNIIGVKNGMTQTLDVAPTEERARELVGEFQLAFGDDWQISYEAV